MTSAHQTDESTYAANIRHVLARSTRDDIRDGTDWYPSASLIASAIATETRSDPRAVAAIIAALSPRNKWAMNIDDARRFCLAASRGESTRPVAHTFHSNSSKAWRIANGENWASVLSGRKVESFVANIGTRDYNRVTVDVWAVRVATLGERDAVTTDAMYRTIEHAYQTVAAEVGLEPATLQAIVWVAAKRIVGTAKTAASRSGLLAA